MWLGGLGFEAGSDQDFNLYLLLSRVATAHAGGRARGGYPLGVGEARKGRREGLKGKAGNKGKLGLRVGWVYGKAGQKRTWARP